MIGHDHPISNWRQQGRICFWRFEVPKHHRFSGWHFTADKSGCDSFLELLGLAKISNEVISRTLSLSASVAISQSRVVGGNAASLKVYCPEKLRISYRPDGECQCIVTEEDRVLAMTFGLEISEKLAESISRVHAHDGDFTIDCGDAKKGNKLWFWWWLDR